MNTKLILAVMLALASVACQQGSGKNTESNSNSPLAPTNNSAEAPSADSSAFTQITWLDQNQDFDKVTEGQKVDVAFHFRNSGDKPLIIESVHPACGCTAAEPPKEPILPGKEGVIKGTFDSNGRVGINNKSIYVKANTFGGTEHDLHFKVEVVKK